MLVTEKYWPSVSIIPHRKRVTCLRNKYRYLSWLENNNLYKTEYHVMT